jgi:hypothetical protein
MLTLELAQPRTGLAWQSLYSICHIPRRKNTIEGMEAAITALLADKGGRGGADSDGYKKSVILY